MADCLFCKIAAKEIDSDIVFESANVIAFRDVNPAGPSHVLVIPKEHIGSAHDLTRAHGEVLGEVFESIVAVADSEGVNEGYRVVTNVGPDAGQSVFHLHFHVIGGRQLSWPPG